MAHTLVSGSCSMIIYIGAFFVSWKLGFDFNVCG